MKKVISIIFIISLATSTKSLAQDTTNIWVKLVEKTHYIGLYAAPELQYGQLNGAFTPMGGGSIMFLLNKKWGLGVTGQQTLNAKFSPLGIKPLVLDAQFWGIRGEYTPRPDAKFHLTFPLTVGMAIAGADSLNSAGERINGDRFDIFNTGVESSEYVIIQPSIQFEANLMRYAKIFAGANYRVAFSSETGFTVLPKNTLQGFSINVGLKIGLFDFNLKKVSNN